MMSGTRRTIEPVRRKLEFKRKDGWMKNDIHIRDYVEWKWFEKRWGREMRKYG